MAARAQDAELEADAPSIYVPPNPEPDENMQHSLFGEILDWMLAPLLLLWPMSIAITYLVAKSCLLYTSPSPRDRQKSRMPSSA